MAKGSALSPTFEQALERWACHATEEELDLGPTLDDLGGIEVVARDVDRVVIGPQLPYLIKAVARDFDELSDEQLVFLLDAAARGMQESYAAWILAEALDTVCEHRSLSARLGSRLARDLTKIAEAALTAQPQSSESAFAHPAISGLLRLATSGQTKSHRLLVLLTEITGSEPAEALERLPTLIGLAHDHFGESDLLEVLVALEGQLSLSLDCRADATFELGVADVRAALEGTDFLATEGHLRRALFRFNQLDRSHEARLDARAYAAAIEAILAFVEYGQGDPSAEMRLGNAVERLSRTTAQFTAWTGRVHELSWLSARGFTRSAWSCLVTTLYSASEHLNEPSWWNPVVALNDLLDVYVASRSVYAYRVDDTDVLGQFVSPTIEAAFLRTEGLRHQLEQAITTDPLFKDNPDARWLYEAVQQQRQNSRTVGELPGKVLLARPALAGLFDAGTMSLRENIDPTLLDELDERVSEHVKGFALTGNVRVDAHLETLIEQLSFSPAWVTPECHYFTRLVTAFLRFLYDRFDAQADLYGARTAYLGPVEPTTSGKVGYWPEKALQDDLHQHLSAVLEPGTVHRETSDVAGGRTDVTYTPRLGNRFVAEVKRRKTRFTRGAVERDYLSQAANYTATGPPFGLLVVGDHSGHDGGYSDIDDRVWIAQHSRSPSEIPRLILIGVLPIGRPTPSDLRMPQSGSPAMGS